jgi:hypothetical protein
MGSRIGDRASKTRDRLLGQIEAVGEIHEEHGRGGAAKERDDGHDERQVHEPRERQAEQPPSHRVARFIGAPRSSGGRLRRAPAAPRAPRASPPR